MQKRVFSGITSYSIHYTKLYEDDIDQMFPALHGAADGLQIQSGRCRELQKGIDMIFFNGAEQSARGLGIAENVGALLIADGGDFVAVTVEVAACPAGETAHGEIFTDIGQHRYGIKVDLGTDVRNNFV